MYQAHRHESMEEWVTLLVPASSNTKSSNFRNSETPCLTSPTLSWHQHELRNSFNCSCCMDCLLAFLANGRSYVILPAATFAASHERETAQRIVSTRETNNRSMVPKLHIIKTHWFPSLMFPHNVNINVDLPFACPRTASNQLWPTHI